MATTSQPGTDTQAETIAGYVNLRRGIGIVGIALPFVLLIGHRALLESISSSYYTEMRNWFVGMMWVTGFFLIFYQYRRTDNILSTLAGVLAIVVALCPAARAVPPPSSATRFFGVVHIISAACFLLLLAYFCLFLFTKSDRLPGQRTRQKNTRNSIYRGCGIAIVVAVVVGGLSELPAMRSARNSWAPVFWCESIAVVAFGIAWLVKGQTLFRDPVGQAQVPAAATGQPADPAALQAPAPAAGLAQEPEPA